MAVRGFRNRYIAFRIEDNLERREMIKHINRIGREISIRLNLTVFEGNKGIVRVEHKEQQAAIDAMNSCSAIKIHTLKTSGTIKKAKSYLV